MFLLIVHKYAFICAKDYFGGRICLSAENILWQSGVLFLSRAQHGKSEIGVDPFILDCETPSVTPENR